MGAFSDKCQIENSFEAYKHYIESPATMDQRSYMFHNENRKAWTEEEYKKFLIAFEKFMDQPVNNKKIAKFIGPQVDPNHVRFVKGAYVRRLRQKAKHRSITVKQALSEDI